MGFQTTARAVERPAGARRAQQRPARGMLLVSALLALTLTGCSLTRSATPTPRTAASPTVAPGVIPTPGGLPRPTGTDRKIDSVLLDIAQTYRDQGRGPAEQQARDAGVIGRNDEIRLTLVLTTNDTKPVTDKVQALGGKIVGTTDNIVDLTVPLDVVLSYVNNTNGNNILQDLAAFETVREVRVTPKPEPKELGLPEGATLAAVRQQIALVASEGVARSGAEAWHAAGSTGKGVRIGVIDGGFAGYEGLLGKELPTKVDARAFNSTGKLYEDETEIHGTACAEIVHAMAPDAELFLAAVDGASDLMKAVRWLVDEQKVKVISMSLGWDGQTRGDGTGAFAEAVNYARGKGVLFVTAAGNEADKHYAGTFTDGDGDGWHEFAAGKESLRVRTGAGLQVVLNWDAWSGERVNYDLYIYDSNDKLVASSRNDQLAGRDPVEVARARTQSGGTYQIRIQRAGNASRNAPLKIITNTPLLELASATGSLTVPADAKAALTVGATNVQNDVLETYSSQGPTLDGRLKPEISAPTVVSTASYNKFGRKFNGTSAATPHVAGAAGLIFGAQPGATADTVQSFLLEGAKDLEEPGPENKTGYGRLQLGDPARAGQPAAQTPRATATAGGAAPAANGPAFSDPFTNPASGLTTSGEGRYDAGKYRLTPNAANRAAWTTYGPRYGNVRVEVTAQIEGRGAAGIVFGQTTVNDYYLFAVSADGFYTIAHFAGGRWTDVVPWTRHAAIAGAGPNALRLEVGAGGITVTVNGATLTTAPRGALGAGAIGLLATTFAEPGMSATFTNLTVTPIP